MARPWKVTTVQEFADKGEVELKTGPFGTQLHASDYVEQGTPVINVRNIGFGSVVPEKLEFIDTETVARLRSHLLQSKDIVFGRKGAVERHAFIRDEQHGWFQGSDCLRVRVRSSALNPRFLSYTLLTESHKQWMMNQCSHGATMASLNQAIICRIPLRLPDIGTQNRIADILSAYDSLIENNTRRIKVLEQMAQMLYREWFVNFRFPGHAKVKMVESEMGLIPQGWGVGSLSDALVLQRGFDLPKDQRLEGRIPIYAATGINGTHNVAKVKAPGVVTGRSGSLGTVNLVLDDFWPLNTALWVKEFKRSSAAHAYFILKELKLGGFNSGAAVPTLNRNDVHGLPTVLPPTSVLKGFDEHVMPMFRMKETLGRKNSNLRTTRDMLLPKLVSGEVSVENLEKEAVAHMV